MIDTLKKAEEDYDRGLEEGRGRLWQMPWRRQRKIMIEALKKAEEDYDRHLEEGRGRLW